MDLQEFNTRVLGSVGVVDDTGDGHLSLLRDGADSQPLMIGNKRVVLPTSKNLRESDKNTIVYHPLSENITRGESDMIKLLRDLIMFKLTINSVSLVTELGRVAATESEHKRLDSASSQYLKSLREMDEKTYEFLKKVILRIGNEPEKRLVSIALRKGQTDDRDGVRRSVKFKFPVLEEMLENDKEILGIKWPSKKVRANLITLFETVMGDTETRGAFDFGSKNTTAPFFHALMTGFSNVAEQLNGVVKTHRKLLGDDLAETLTIDTSWMEGMDDLSDMRRKVPPQEGNEGNIIVAAAPAEKEKERERVSEKLADRLTPHARPAAESATRREGSREREVLPWEDDDSDRPTVTVPKGKSLDDFLYGDRGGRDRDRGDRFGRGRERDDRGDRFGRGRERDRFSRERDRTRDFDLGMEGDRDRDRGDRFGRERDDRWSGRDFRRDERGGSRRPFGSGHTRSGF